MSDLKQFLDLPDVGDIEADVFVSKRVGTFKVKAMTAIDFEAYRRKAGMKMNNKNLEFDSTKFFISMIAGQTISPDFANADLLAKSNCISPEQLVSKKLLMGEIVKLATKIQEISGFDDDINENIEEAKN